MRSINISLGSFMLAFQLESEDNKDYCKVKKDKNKIKSKKLQLGHLQMAICQLDVCGSCFVP